MTMRRHFLLPLTELFVALFASLCLVLLPFKHSLFPGIPTTHLIVASALTALVLLLVLLLQLLGDFACEWRLDGTTLVKRRTRPPNEDIARIDLRQILRFRASREVSFVGQLWELKLVMNEIVEQPPVYLEFLGVRLTGRAGMHRTHYFHFLSPQDKDIVVSAIESAAKPDGAG